MQNSNHTYPYIDKVRILNLVFIKFTFIRTYNRIGKGTYTSHILVESKCQNSSYVFDMPRFACFSAGLICKIICIGTCLYRITIQYVTTYCIVILCFYQNVACVFEYHLPLQDRGEKTLTNPLV